jgi:hypothetical protein
MIQVYKHARRVYRSAFNVASALKALINVYHRLFLIIPALKSENYNKKKQIEIPFPK